jgi:hypothetical protein
MQPKDATKTMDFDRFTALFPVASVGRLSRRHDSIHDGISPIVLGWLPKLEVKFVLLDPRAKNPTIPLMHVSDSDAIPTRGRSALPRTPGS